tara:strand:- start:6657 stop:6845 length:189 start_codon:yes stop_codon:yes gene_type:complete
MNASAVEQRRITHINVLMDQFYDHNANIYEHLVDREIDKCRDEVESFITKLKELQQSLSDEL